MFQFTKALGLHMKLQNYLDQHCHTLQSIEKIIIDLEVSNIDFFGGRKFYVKGYEGDVAFRHIVDHFDRLLSAKKPQNYNSNEKRKFDQVVMILTEKDLLADAKLDQQNIFTRFCTFCRQCFSDFFGRAESRKRFTSMQENYEFKFKPKVAKQYPNVGILKEISELARAQFPNHKIKNPKFAYDSKNRILRIPKKELTQVKNIGMISASILLEPNVQLFDLLLRAHIMRGDFKYATHEFNQHRKQFESFCTKKGILHRDQWENIKSYMNVLKLIQKLHYYTQGNKLFQHIMSNLEGPYAHHYSYTSNQHHAFILPKQSAIKILGFESIHALLKITNKLEPTLHILHAFNQIDSSKIDFIAKKVLQLMKIIPEDHQDDFRNELYQIIQIVANLPESEIDGIIKNFGNVISLYYETNNHTIQSIFEPIITWISKIPVKNRSEIIEQHHSFLLKAKNQNGLSDFLKILNKVPPGKESEYIHLLEDLENVLGEDSFSQIFPQQLDNHWNYVYELIRLLPLRHTQANGLHIAMAEFNVDSPLHLSKELKRILLQLNNEAEITELVLAFKNLNKDDIDEILKILKPVLESCSPQRKIKILKMIAKTPPQLQLIFLEQTSVNYSADEMRKFILKMSRLQKIIPSQDDFSEILFHLNRLCTLLDGEVDFQQLHNSLIKIPERERSSIIQCVATTLNEENRQNFKPEMFTLLWLYPEEVRQQVIIECLINDDVYRFDDEWEAIAETLHNSTPELKSKMDKRIGYLLTPRQNEEKGEARILKEIASSIYRNEIQGLEREDEGNHPLFTHIAYRLADTTGSHHRFSIWRKLYDLRNLPATRFPKEVQKMGESHVTFNFEGLKANGKIEEIKLNDLPINGTLENWILLRDQLKNEIENEVGDVKSQQMENEIVLKTGHKWNHLLYNTFLSPYLKELLSFDETSLSFTQAQLACIIHYIMDQSDEREDGHLLTKKQTCLLMIFAGIQECRGGKKEGIANTYNLLPKQYKLKIIKNDGLPPLNAGAIESIHQYTQKFIADQFCGTNLLMKELTETPADEEIAQAAHQGLYLKNLIGQIAGLKHTLTYDTYAGIVKYQFLNKDRDDVIQTYFKHVTTKKMVDSVMQSINQELHEASIFNRGSIYQMYSSLFPEDELNQYWEVNDEGEFQILRKGVILLLEKANYLNTLPLSKRI